MLHIIKYQQYDVVNGPGIRCSIWLAGCNNHCKNCWSTQTWNPVEGTKFIKVVDNIIKCVNNPRIDGISILGGDPLYWVMNKDLDYPEATITDNISDIFIADSINQLYYLLSICKKSGKPVWLWTGYLYEDILKKEPKILDYIDVLIDGKFEESKKDLNLYWRGSSNQRIIDVKKSLKENKIVLYE